MDLMEAMKARHSVRQYMDKPLKKKAVEELQAEIDACNQESRLHIQLVRNEPKAFDGFMAHYGKFSGVTNYIAMIGKKGPDLEEKCGYYGERLVLKAGWVGHLPRARILSRPLNFIKVTPVPSARSPLLQGSARLPCIGC